MIEGEISTDEPGYVFGRGVTNEEIRAAARAAQFPDDGIAEIARFGLPPRFRRFASAPVIPNGTFGEVIALEGPARDQFVRIGAYNGNAATGVLTRFWNATVENRSCGDSSYRDGHRRVGSTEVTVRGGVPKAVVDQIVANLKAVDQQRLDAFRSQVG